MKYKRMITLLILVMIFVTIQGLGLLVKAEADATPSKSALVVADPGFTKFCYKMGEKITAQLTKKGYAAKLITPDQFKAQDAAKVDVLVIGGPTIASQTSGGLKKVIGLLDKNNPAKILLYITGVLKDESGLDTSSKLMAEKGLTITAKAKFLASDKETANNDRKINQLLESI